MRLEGEVQDVLRLEEQNMEGTRRGKQRSFRKAILEIANVCSRIDWDVD